MDAVEAFGKPVFHGQITAAQIETDINTGKVHGFCGIAKPEKFRASLEAQGVEIVGFTAFADHHNFTDSDAQKLLDTGEVLMTTQKDMARLRGAPSGSARAILAATAQVLPVKLAVDNAAALMHAIDTALADGQANQLYKSY
jgi:tetraacyldisaccharide 4'-kinase